MDEKNMEEMSLEDLKKIVGGQGESVGEGILESNYHCKKCNGTKFRIWRESPTTWSYYITCVDCGDTRYVDCRWGLQENP